MRRHLARPIALLIPLAGAACAVEGPPAFPRETTATLAGPLCARPGRPCRCADDAGEAGTAAPGMRRFEVRLPAVQGTSSAVAVEGIGSMVRDEASSEPSCFYFDGRLGATYQVRYLVAAQDRERGLSIAFEMRELSDEGAWYDVLLQRCGTAREPCHYEGIHDWTEAISGGHRFHDRCGSTRLTGMRVDGGTYGHQITDGQLSLEMNLRQEGPVGPPGGSCRDPILPPGTEGGADRPAAE